MDNDRHSLHPLHPWIETERAPLYVIRLPSTPRDEDLETFCEARESWAKRARFPCAWVVDLSALKTPSAVQRRSFAEHLKRFEAHDVAYNQGSALIAPNAVVKGLLTAVFWLAPPKFPHQAFANEADAARWAQGRLDAQRTRPSQSVSPP